MGAAISGFISTWSPSFYSTANRAELRNVRQGGNDLLAAIPQGAQAMWVGSVLAKVSEVSQGPLKLIAGIFSVICNPLISFPLSIFACAVKEKFYESSVSCPLREQTKHFELGDEVRQRILGTVSLLVGDSIRHFVIKEDVTWEIEHSIELNEGGQRKRFFYHRLENGEPFDERCREVDLNGARVRIRLLHELSAEYKNACEVSVQGERRFFSLGREVAEPIQGTVRVSHFGVRHHRIGNEIAQETPDSIRIHVAEGTLHYDTGAEIGRPAAGSRSFMINGKMRHFASAKFVVNPSLGLSGWFNLIPKLPFKFPTRLSRFTIRSLELINKHMSEVVRVALIAGGVALTVLGHYAMAAGVLLAVTYEILDQDLGVIPRKVSLFMEKWMPLISMVGLLIVGSPFMQVMAGATLLLMVPSVNLMIHHKISRGVKAALLAANEKMRDWLRSHGLAVDDRVIRSIPLLEECDAPLVENKRLNRDQIHAVLAANDDAYEFNPAHFTKMDRPLVALAENNHFTELTRLWDLIGPRWIEEQTYSRLFNRLMDDERFFMFLKTRFPQAERFTYIPDWNIGDGANRRAREELERAHRIQVEEWVIALARENGVTKQQFVADWVKQQLQFFVAKLSGARPIEGSQRLLADAIQNSAKIIPFLTDPHLGAVHLEDALTKLAIEGGDYCTLALRRASREVLEGFTEPLYNQVQAGAPEDEQRAFEKEVRHELQKLRHHLIQIGYRQYIMPLFERKEGLRNLSEDIHLYEATTRALKRGLYPLENSELEEFDLTQLIYKEVILLPAQILYLRAYKHLLPNTINAIGIDRRDFMRNRVLEYLRTWVEGNDALSERDKTTLLDGALSNDAEHMADYENYQKWNRLMLFVLGILRERR